MEDRVIRVPKKKKAVDKSRPDAADELPIDEAVALETLKQLKAEWAIRVERKKQAKEGGLIEFVRYFWNILEPETRLVEGWLLYDICRHLEAVTFGKITRLLINVPPGPGWVENEVMTERGRVRLGDLTVGDRVLTHRGRYRSVTAAFPRGQMPTLEITTHSGRSMVLTPDHNVLTPDGWIEAGMLKVGDVLGWVTPQEDVLHDKVTAEEARLLGYLVGDGSLTQGTPTFHNSEADVLEDFERCAAKLGFATSRTPPKGPRVSWCVRLLGGDAVKGWLSLHDQQGRSSYTKYIPERVLASSNDIIRNFLGAYWSCDGLFVTKPSKRRGSIYQASATTVSHRLAFDLQHALGRIGIRSKVGAKSRSLISKSQPGGIYRSFDVAVFNEADVSLFYDMPGLSQRKNAQAALASRRRFPITLNEDRIVSVVDGGTRECMCVSVDEDCSLTWGDIAVSNSMKSLMVNVFWPAWEWGPMNMPHLRYVSFSYSSGLTERDNTKFRKLIQSEKYQELWGDRFKVEKEGEIKITNDKTGSKFASSVGGIGTGERGDRVTIDDPHDVHKSESDIVRTATVRWFRETITDRLNNLDESAIIIIMQRVHQSDISGFILAEGWQYCHLMVPMEFEAGRQPYNPLGWVDPRTEEGDLAWPERFSPEAVAKIEIEKGSWAYAGQYQQRPAPRGGGIIKREHWRPYTPDDCGKFGVPWPKFPMMSYTVLSLDTAQTEKKQNDPSAGVVLGICRDIWENRRCILMWGWAERLELYELVKKVEETCRKFKVDRVLIEDKASGHPVAQELRRRARNIADSLSHNPKTADRADFGVTLVTPEGDKVARMYAVQNVFECGMIYAPAEATGSGDYLFKDWADKVMDECATMPKGEHDDRADAMSQGLKHLRDLGLLTLPDEAQNDEEESKRYRPEPRPLYPAFGGPAYPMPMVWNR